MPAAFCTVQCLLHQLYVTFCCTDEAWLLEDFECSSGSEAVADLDTSKTSLLCLLDNCFCAACGLPDPASVHSHLLHCCSTLQPGQAFVVDLDLKRYSIFF